MLREREMKSLKPDCCMYNYIHECNVMMLLLHVAEVGRVTCWYPRLCRVYVQYVEFCKETKKWKMQYEN